MGGGELVDWENEQVRGNDKEGGEATVGRGKEKAQCVGVVHVL